MELGEFISLRRKQSGLTIDELSAKSNIPKGTINKIIAGITKDPQLETIRAIARALDCTLDDLYIACNGPTDIDMGEYPVMAKYRRLTDGEKTRIDEMIDRTLSGQPIGDIAATQKKPAPTNEDGQTLIEKRLLTLFQQIPESSQPFVLDMIEAALKSQGLL